MRPGATLGAAEPGATEPGGVVSAAGQARDCRQREQAGLADHGTRRASRGTHQPEAPGGSPPHRVSDGRPGRVSDGRRTGRLGPKAAAASRPGTTIAQAPVAQAPVAPVAPDPAVSHGQPDTARPGARTSDRARAGIDAVTGRPTAPQQRATAIGRARLRAIHGAMRGAGATVPGPTAGLAQGRIPGARGGRAPGMPAGRTAATGPAVRHVTAIRARLPGMTGAGATGAGAGMTESGMAGGGATAHGMTGAAMTGAAMTGPGAAGAAMTVPGATGCQVADTRARGSRAAGAGIAPTAFARAGIAPSEIAPAGIARTGIAATGARGSRGTGSATTFGCRPCRSASPPTSLIPPRGPNSGRCRPTSPTRSPGSSLQRDGPRIPSAATSTRWRRGAWRHGSALSAKPAASRRIAPRSGPRHSRSCGPPAGSPPRAVTCR